MRKMRILFTWGYFRRFFKIKKEKGLVQEPTKESNPFYWNNYKQYFTQNQEKRKIKISPILSNVSPHFAKNL